MAPMRPLLTTPPNRSPGPRRFPLRTLILMVLALVVFARLWWITHRAPPPRPSPEIRLHPTPRPGQP